MKTQNEGIPITSVAIALRESGEYKATNNLCGLLKECFDEKIFFPSFTLMNLRLEESTNDRIDYRMKDGSVISMSKSLNENLCRTLDTNTVSNMTRDANSFIAHLVKLKESFDGE